MLVIYQNFQKNFEEWENSVYPRDFDSIGLR